MMEKLFVKKKKTMLFITLNSLTFVLSVCLKKATDKPFFLGVWAVQLRFFG